MSKKIKTFDRAIEIINKNKILLVFPIKNAKEPRSLWSEFHPRTDLKWEWNESGDNRVFEMWALMKSLSCCKQVVYSKWYMGRATFFSKDLFVAMLRLMKATDSSSVHLTRTARTIMSELESNSPLSTKELKNLTDLKGRDNESQYNRAMKELFSQLQIIAFGEVEDGAFPSLAVGATQLIYEDLWLESEKLSLKNAQTLVDMAMPEGTNFRKFFDKILENLSKNGSRV